MLVFLSLLCSGNFFLLSCFGSFPLPVFPPRLTDAILVAGTNCGGIDSSEHNKESTITLYEPSVGLLFTSPVSLQKHNIISNTDLSPRHTNIKLNMRSRPTVLNTQFSRHETII